MPDKDQFSKETIKLSLGTKILILARMDKQFLNFSLGFGLLLLISVFASKTTKRFGIPIILIFIILGMLTGADGILGVPFENAELTQILGTTSLTFILFSGGLSTRLENVTPVWREGVLLSTVGVIVSTLMMAVIIDFVTGWGMVQSALLGATFSSTDAAAVFSILKTHKL